MGKIAFVFPGQGAQIPGMGLSAYENSAAAKEIFDKADAIRPGTSAQCFTGTADELKITANTQSCLYAVESALAAVLTEQGIKADMCAGFSLGELSALYYAGAMDFESGMKLVMKRGQLMQEDAEKAETFMAAVIRLPQDKLMEIISGFENVYAVNFNGGTDYRCRCRRTPAGIFRRCEGSRRQGNAAQSFRCFPFSIYERSC